MEKSTLARWEPRHRASIRHRVAREAARLLYQREFKEYLHAKREAARRHGTHHLPTNREVREQLLLVARSLQGAEHGGRLQAMRQTALGLMALLADFDPRLVGSVLTGHIRSRSDIDLHLYSEDLCAICQALTGGGYKWQVETVRTHKGQLKDFIHVRVADANGYEVEMTLHEPARLGVQPRCGITGGPMPRATFDQVEALLCAETRATRLPLLSSPINLAEIAELVPELSACRGVLQDNYHHLDVYEHTLAVLRRAQNFVAEKFSRFGVLGPALQAHFASTEATALLFLAAICHNLGKPGSQTIAHNGTIGFPGHERLSAQMTSTIADRLGISSRQRLVDMVAWRPEVVHIAEHGGPSSSISKLFRAVADHLPELALLSLADLEATLGPAQTDLRLEEHALFVDFMLQQYFEGGFLVNPILPVSREDLEEEFALTDGTQQDLLLSWLLDEFVDGEFEGKEEGLCLASDYLAASPFQVVKYKQ